MALSTEPQHAGSAGEKHNESAQLTCKRHGNASGKQKHKKHERDKDDGTGQHKYKHKHQHRHKDLKISSSGRVDKAADAVDGLSVAAEVRRLQLHDIQAK